MKRSILIIASLLISAVTFAQCPVVKHQVKTKKAAIVPLQKKVPSSKLVTQPATGQFFTLGIPESQLLYQVLSDDKAFYSLSDDISARKANTLYIPRADSLIRILIKQDKAYQDASKLKAHNDSLQVKKDTLKK